MCLFREISRVYIFLYKIVYFNAYLTGVWISPSFSSKNCFIIYFNSVVCVFFINYLFIYYWITYIHIESINLFVCISISLSRFGSIISNDLSKMCLPGMPFLAMLFAIAQERFLCKGKCLFRIQSSIRVIGGCFPGNRPFSIYS